MHRYRLMLKAPHPCTFRPFYRDFPPSLPRRPSHRTPPHNKRVFGSPVGTSTLLESIPAMNRKSHDSNPCPSQFPTVASRPTHLLLMILPRSNCIMPGLSTVPKITCLGSACSLHMYMYMHAVDIHRRMQFEMTWTCALFDLAPNKRRVGFTTHS